jgi:hypothetical protein
VVAEAVLASALDDALVVVPVVLVVPVVVVVPVLPV